MYSSVKYYVSFVVKILIVSTTILLQPAFGANPAQIENSADDLTQAIKPSTGSTSVSAIDIQHYIPGYGLHLTFEKVVRIPKLDDAIKQLSTALLDEGGTIEGLPKGEWISIFFRGKYGVNIYDLVIRMKQGRPDTLEVWINGLPSD